ncbi:hypothetical protein GOBAR_DD13170 [Gossypium barbadense]|nr:hypothetical protein GOBAR_DD13170 [Gossypium barbadense]
MTRLANMPILEWQTQWMQHMGDIMIHIAEQNGWPRPVPLLDMFEMFPPPSEEGANDDQDDKEEEETPIMPPNYERVFQLDHSSMKGVVIRNPSYHNLT